MLQPMNHTRPQILMSPFTLRSMAPPPVGTPLPLHLVAPDLAPGTDGFGLIHTGSGRDAIGAALRALTPDPSDEVLIHTTTGGAYVSGCVTAAIGRHCAWSRRPGPRTRAILAVHEFGTPAVLPDGLRALGLPVISDCAYAMGVPGATNAALFPADFYVFSFSKCFEMPSGGALVSAPRYRPTPTVDATLAAEIAAQAARHHAGLSAQIDARRRNWALYRQAFARHGFHPHALQADMSGAVPHAFVLEHDDDATLLSARAHLNGIGIESSVYFQNGGYFLPCHQSLCAAAIDYIVAAFIEGLTGTSQS